MAERHEKRRSAWPFAVVVLALLGTVAVGAKDRWLPLLGEQQPQSIVDKLELHVQEHDHDHDHAEGSVVALSEQGLRNVGYEPYQLQLRDYERMLTLPAMVVGRPGRSEFFVTAPLTGIVTNIYCIPGEAVEEGQPLFDLRLTHEELVAAQREFLRNVENLGVVNREIERLQGLSEGVIAGRRVLEQQYERQKLEASLHAETQAMLLHGLTQEQVDEIRETRKLFRSITIRVPVHDHSQDMCPAEHTLQIRKLSVSQGQQIEAGSQLAVLGDHCELMIEGLAFEDDAAKIRRATREGHKARARLLVEDDKLQPLENLEVLYVADQIDTESRAFKFYLRLPNEIALDKRSQEGKRFIEWVFKPGQRMQLELPVETWKVQLVVPTEAVIDEGAESYVYEQHGDHFDRVPVHVVHRDQNWVVLDNDGSLHAGDTIAGNGAYQIHLALKNQAGGAVDPHAGHNH